MPLSKEPWVTAADDVSKLGNSTELAQKLTLVSKNGEFLTNSKVILEFDTPIGIASPINRVSPGFISPGTGKTFGGAREFVVPNLELSTLKNLTVRKVP